MNTCYSVTYFAPVWAQGRFRISPPRFLAECCKRQLNQVSLVLLLFRLSAFSDLYWVCLFVFSCTVLFVSISQVIGCEDRLRNDLYCVGWGVKLYSNQTKRRILVVYQVICADVVDATSSECFLVSCFVNVKVTVAFCDIFWKIDASWTD